MVEVGGLRKGPTSPHIYWTRTKNAQVCRTSWIWGLPAAAKREDTAGLRYSPNDGVALLVAPPGDRSGLDNSASRMQTDGGSRCRFEHCLRREPAQLSTRPARSRHWIGCPRRWAATYPTLAPGLAHFFGSQLRTTATATHSQPRPTLNNPSMADPNQLSRVTPSSRSPPWPSTR